MPDRSRSPRGPRPVASMGVLGRAAREEVASSETVSSASRISGSDLPRAARRAARLAGEPRIG